MEDRIKKIEDTLSNLIREVRPVIIGHIAAVNETLTGIPMPQGPYWVPEDLDDGEIAFRHLNYSFYRVEEEVVLSTDEGSDVVGNCTTLKSAQEIVEAHKAALQGTREDAERMDKLDPVPGSEEYVKQKEEAQKQ